MALRYGLCSFAPSGLALLSCPFPRLAPWAAFYRSSGAVVCDVAFGRWRVLFIVVFPI